MSVQEKYDWMVCVRCFTYNHAPYIIDSLNGFTIQKTTFPYVCCIVDDSSTDGEQEVIKNYLNDHFDLEDKKVARHEETDDYVLTFARHKINLKCHFAVLYLKYNHYKKKSKTPYILQWRDKAKYIAICEGDDYWIAPEKLQTQVALLENNVSCGLVYSNYFKLEKGKIIKGNPVGKCDFEYLIGNDEIATLTTCFRAELLNDYIKFIQPENKDWQMGDLPMWLYMASQKDVKFIDKPFAVYRVLVESASHSRDICKIEKFLESSVNIRLFFLNKYGDLVKNPRKVAKNIIGRHQVIPLVKYYSKRGCLNDAKSVFKRNKNTISFTTRCKCCIYIIYAFFKRFIS